ncbi:hypothetical protein LEN26_018953 [Aphanomyces euteiches]|nr:hypothetical protein LEN26_018953 [Aphanomyces euteiches]
MAALPCDVVEHIAFFVQDPSDFFSYLEVFADVVGPSLGALWSLSKTHLRHDLWPQLHVRTLDTPTVAAAFRLASSCFPIVHFHKGIDTEHVKLCLPLHAAMAWYDDHLTFQRRSSDTLVQFPIANLTMRFQYRRTLTSSSLWTKLPLLTSLRSLTLCGLSCDAIRPLLCYVRDSQLTAFTLVECEGAMCSIDDVTRLTHWLTHAPVTRLSLCGCHFAVDTVTMQKFLHALFSSLTMRHIKTSFRLQGLSSLDLSIPAQLTTLELLNARLDDLSMQRFSNSLRYSQVSLLDMSGSVFTPAMMESLANCLPHTKIKTLRLCHVNLTAGGSSVLSKVLPITQIRKLTLTSNRLTDKNAIDLACAVQLAVDLRELDLCDNAIGTEGAIALVEAICKRSAPMTRLNLSWNKVSSSQIQTHLMPFPWALKACQVLFNSWSKHELPE